MLSHASHAAGQARSARTPAPSRLSWKQRPATFSATKAQSLDGMPAMDQDAESTHAARGAVGRGAVGLAVGAGAGRAVGAALGAPA